jgi:hypothetical protein
MAIDAYCNNIKLGTGKQIVLSSIQSGVYWGRTRFDSS